MLVRHIGRWKKAQAHVVIDYGIDDDLRWVCFLDDSRECWTFRNQHVRAVDNTTEGRVDRNIIKELGMSTSTSTGPAPGTPRVISTSGLVGYTVDGFTFYTSQQSGTVTFSVDGGPPVTVTFSGGSFTVS